MRPRNEALDCRVYARAAAMDWGLDRMQDKHWQELEQQLGIMNEAIKKRLAGQAKDQTPAEVPAPGLSIRDTRGDSYWGERTRNWWNR